MSSAQGFTMNLEHAPRGCRATDPAGDIVYTNLEIAALRYPSARDDLLRRVSTYSQLKQQVDALAGFLQRDCGVRLATASPSS